MCYTISTYYIHNSNLYACVALILDDVGQQRCMIFARQVYDGHTVISVSNTWIKVFNTILLLCNVCAHIGGYIIIHICILEFTSTTISSKKILYSTDQIDR